MITDVINVFSFKFGLMALCCVNQSTGLFGVSLGVAKLLQSAILKCENTNIFLSLLKLFEN